jgi:hypothetical protein
MKIYVIHATEERLEKEISEIREWFEIQNSLGNH